MLDGGDFILATSSFDQQYYALLASRVREGDADAFTELYMATYDTMYRSVSCFLRDPDDVYDALQEIYLSVYKNISSLKIDRLVMPWMRQIAHNVCCDFAREAKTQREFSAELDEELMLTLSSSEDPYRTVSERELWSFIVDVLTKRSVKERQAFLLRYENGLKLEEVAGFMGVSLASVKRYITAARTALQEALVDHSLVA